MRKRQIKRFWAKVFDQECSVCGRIIEDEEYGEIEGLGILCLRCLRKEISPEECRRLKIRPYRRNRK